MIIQIAIEGTDEDVAAVKKDLDECFGKGCFIPCPNDSSKGCMTKVTTVVKKYGSIPQDEVSGYHYVQMVDNDGLPSNAYIGTPNNGASSGTWRRNEPTGTYCHEVLHFCGLEDKYCDRRYDPVKDSVIVARNCVPPPDPGGDCCTPGANNTRCTVACADHETDIMGASGASMSCDNIMDVLKGVGMNNCPPECCGSNMTFTRPPDEIYIIPGYYHFGDKYNKFGSIGGSLGYTKQLGSTLGITIEGGYYNHTEKHNNIKETSGLMHITGGVTARVTDPNKSKVSISTHALIGISRYTEKTTVNDNTYKQDETSFHFNIGAAADLKLNRKLSLRLLQADYAPTFFFDAMQHNFRVSAGLVLKLGEK
jgi:hypothetical protein